MGNTETDPPAAAATSPVLTQHSVDSVHDLLALAARQDDVQHLGTDLT